MKKISRFLALLLASALLLTSCGLTPPTAKATTMHLRRTEGRISVSDDAGEDVEVREDLGLYSGYEVETKRKSYAWIDLDEVKLTKLDEKSEIEITKEDKQLEIEVLSGSLFFNITEPLEDDETMTIRSSTMAVGIRGTCGWVALEDKEHLTLCLLEGKVECTAGEESVRVSAGETARMSEDGEIEVTPFAESDIPTFVLDELDKDFLDKNQDLFAAPVVLASEPPLIWDSLYRPAPDFLNEEQKKLYLHAACAADVFLGGNPSGINYFPLADGSEFVWNQDEFGTVELDGQFYVLAQGRYRQWTDFQVMMSGLFTPEYQRKLIGNRFRSNEDGRLCYMETLLIDSSYYLGAETDTYELVSQSEDEIRFNQICHYITLEFEDPERAGEPYTVSHSVRMVRTDQGWRIAEIYVLREDI